MRDSSWYVMEGGCRCPNCESGAVQLGPLDADGPGAWAKCTCVSCGSKWTDIYELVGYHEIQIGVKKEE